MAGGKYLNDEDALKKLQAYCAYQERCHQEVRSKLIELGVYGDRLESIIADLIAENYLNEERFAIAFVGGRFRIKHWGRGKIVQELKTKRISDYCIKKALAQEIDAQEYRATLLEVMKKKNHLLAEPSPYKRKQKLVLYAISRGFESDLAWEVVAELMDGEQE